jgi:hypothetical protein
VWCVSLLTCSDTTATWHRHTIPPAQDTVAVQELRFGDNDTLSAQVCGHWGHSGPRTLGGQGQGLLLRRTTTPAPTLC